MVISCEAVHLSARTERPWSRNLCLMASTDAITFCRSISSNTHEMAHHAPQPVDSTISTTTTTTIMQRRPPYHYSVNIGRKCWQKQRQMPPVIVFWFAFRRQRAVRRRASSRRVAALCVAEREDVNFIYSSLMSNTIYDICLIRISTPYHPSRPAPVDTNPYIRSITCIR